MTSEGTEESFNNLVTSLPTRWEIELEFVQSLCNIQYLNYLAQNSYLNDEAFVLYLEYLNYWTLPQYAKHLVYPNCLHILTLLQSEEFRKNIANPEFMSSLMNDMVKRWQEPEKEKDGEDKGKSEDAGDKETEVKEEKIEVKEEVSNGLKVPNGDLNGKI